MVGTDINGSELSGRSCHLAEAIVPAPTLHETIGAQPACVREPGSNCLELSLRLDRRGVIVAAPARDLTGRVECT